MDLSQNYSECIKQTMDFGANIFTNICSGTVVTVQWGSMDYITAAMLSGAVLAILAVLIIVVVLLIKEG